MRIACIVPAHDEEAVLEASVRRIRAWADASFPDDAVTIVISDNGSKDATSAIAVRLACELSNVTHVASPEPGKGGAIKRAAMATDADAYLFMDVDLSTELGSAAELVASVGTGVDLVIASRHAPEASARRTLRRSALSAAYASLASRALDLPFTDLQCGCKAFSRKLRDGLLSSIADNGYFFDTELVAKAFRGGWNVHELPVAWEESRFAGRASKVRLLRQSARFLSALWRLRRELARPAGTP